ncbi:MAG: DegV family protein [Candidatus Thorarchaeota archaeon]
MTVKIICDTSADLNLPNDKTLYDKYDIGWVPMHVIFGTDDYKELLQIKTSVFYEKLYSSEKQPHTSQSTQHDLLVAYEKYGEKYDEIISFHLSSKISGAVANAQFAKKMYEKSNPDSAKVYIYDTLTASSLMGLSVIKAAQLAKEGLNAEEIIAIVKQWQEKDIKLYFTVENLRWLFEGGRLSKTKYYAAKIMSMNPIITFIDGNLEVVKSVTGYDKSISTSLKMLIEHFGDTEVKDLTLHFLESDFYEKAEEIAKSAQKQYPGLNIGEIFRIGGVIASHTGPHCLALMITRNFEF